MATSSPEGFGKALLDEAIAFALKAYQAAREKGQPLGDFLRTFLVDSTLEQAQETLGSIGRTLDDVTTAYRELQEAKGQGSREAWLEERLASVSALAGEADPGDLLAAITEAILSDIPDAASVKNVDTSDALGRRHLVSRVLERLGEISKAHLGAFVDPIAEALGGTEALGVVVDFMQAPLDSAEDRDFKMVVVTALIARKRVGTDPILDQIDELTLPFLVDRALTTVKLIYQVAEGVLEPLDMLEILYDRAVASFAVFIERHAENLGGELGKHVGLLVGLFIRHPAVVATVMTICETVGRRTGKALAPHLGEGVRKLGVVVREVAPEVVRQVQDAVGRAKQLVGKVSGILA